MTSRAIKIKGKLAYVRLKILSASIGLLLVTGFIAGFVDPIYPISLAGAAIVCVSICVQFNILKILIQCPECGSFNPVDNKFDDGPAGRRVYPVMDCRECNTKSIL